MILSLFSKDRCELYKALASLGRFRPKKYKTIEVHGDTYYCAYLSSGESSRTKPGAVEMFPLVWALEEGADFPKELLES